MAQFIRCALLYVTRSLPQTGLYSLVVLQSARHAIYAGDAVVGVGRAVVLVVVDSPCTTEMGGRVGAVWRVVRISCPGIVSGSVSGKKNP